MSVKRYLASLFLEPGYLSEREVVLASDYDAMVVGVALELHSRLEDADDKCSPECWCCKVEKMTQAQRDCESK
jgi:hypothetical protein